MTGCIIYGTLKIDTRFLYCHITVTSVVMETSLQYFMKENMPRHPLHNIFGHSVLLPLRETILSIAVFVIVSRSDWRTDVRTKVLLELDK